MWILQRHFDFIAEDTGRRHGGMISLKRLDGGLREETLCAAEAKVFASKAEAESYARQNSRGAGYMPKRLPSEVSAKMTDEEVRDAFFRLRARDVAAERIASFHRADVVNISWCNSGSPDGSARVPYEDVVSVTVHSDMVEHIVLGYFDAVIVENQTPQDHPKGG